MRKCLSLALKGFAAVSPNPMVGCVIVKDDTIIGEAYHMVFGGPHAEVNAIASVKDPESLIGATVYVSLEPCSHFGKTPPCADLLINSKVSKVIVGMMDPNPLVSGKGIEKLRQAGIEVICGVLENDCRFLNRRFVVNQTLKRPYVILKWAESSDGFMSGKFKKISGLAAQTRLHKWRSEEDAFLVGTNTLLIDNPGLSTRLWKGKNPIRIAIDFNLRSAGMKLKFAEGSQRSIILNGIREGKDGNIEYIKIDSKEPNSIIKALQKLGIGSVVIEGGAELLNSFLKARLYDEIRVFKSTVLLLEEGIKAPKLDFPFIESENLLEDRLYIFR